MAGPWAHGATIVGVARDCQLLESVRVLFISANRMAANGMEVILLVLRQWLRTYGMTLCTSPT